MLLRVARFAAVGLLAWTGSAIAADYQVGFSPFIGGGAASDGSDVRHASGYSLAVERNFAPFAGTPGFQLAPRLELTNSFVNTKAATDGGSAVGEGTSISTYDNRIFAAGFSASHAVGNSGTLAQRAYLTAMAGKGYTKLSIDDNSERRYRQMLFGGLSGNYFGGEAGVWIPFDKNFGINIAFLGSIYEAALPENEEQGTQEGQELTDDGRQLELTGSVDPEELEFSKSVYLKTYAAKIGVSLGF